MVCADLATKQDIADLRRDILFAIAEGGLGLDDFDEESDYQEAAIDGGVITIPLAIKAIYAFFVAHGAKIAAVAGIGVVAERIVNFFQSDEINTKLGDIQTVLDFSVVTKLKDLVQQLEDLAVGVNAIQDIVGAVPAAANPPNVNSDTSEGGGVTLTKEAVANLINQSEQRLREYINGHHWGTKQEILGALNQPFPEADYTGITNAIQGLKSSIGQEVRTAVGGITFPEVPDMVTPLKDYIFQQHTYTRTNINNLTSTEAFRVDLNPVLDGIRGLGSQISGLNPVGEIAGQMLGLRAAVTGAISTGYSEVSRTITSSLADIPSLGDFRTLTAHITNQHITTRSAIPGIDYGQFPVFDYQAIREAIFAAHGVTREHVTTVVGGIPISTNVESLRNTVIDENKQTRIELSKIDLTKAEENIKENHNNNKVAIIQKVQDCCFVMDYERINSVTRGQASSVKTRINNKHTDMVNYINRSDLLTSIRGDEKTTLKIINKNIDDEHIATRKHVTDKFKTRQMKVDSEIRENRTWVENKFGKVPKAVGADLFPITVRVGKGRTYRLKSLPGMLQNLMTRLGLNLFPKEYITTPLDGNPNNRKVKDIRSFGQLIEMIGKAVYAPHFPIPLPAKGFKFLEGVPGSGLPKNKILKIKNSGDYIQWLSDRMAEIPISQFGGDFDDADKYGDVYLRTCKIIFRENHSKDSPSQPPFKNANGGPANYYCISLKHLKPGLTWKTIKEMFSGWRWGPYLIEATLESRYTINFRSSDRETGVRAMKKLIAKLIDEEAIKITATYEEVHPSIRKEAKTIYPEEIIVTLKKKASGGSNPDISGNKYTSERVRVVLWTKSAPYGTPRTLTDYQTI